MQTYAGGEIEAKSNGARDAALPRSVGTENHVKIWATAELNIVICNEVLQLYAHYRPGYVSIEKLGLFIDGRHGELLTRLSREVTF